MNVQQARLGCFKAWQLFQKAVRDKLPAEKIHAAEKNFRESRADYLALRGKEQAQ